MLGYLAWSRTWYRVRGSSLSSVKEKGNWKGLVRLAIVRWWLIVIVSSFIVCHGSAKATKIESSYLNEIPLQMSSKGMWGPENMKIKKFRWGLFEFYIFLS